MEKSRRPNVCVFCGSGKDIPVEHLSIARGFGKTLAENGFDLVWGGCTVGSMGAVAEGAQESGGKVIGVLTLGLQKYGIAYGKADELIMVADLLERKQKMDEISDAFVMLPGGIGTLDEFISLLENQMLSKRLGKPAKKNAILNVNGFYDPLYELLEHLYREKFAYESNREVYRFCNTAEEVIEYLKEK